MARHKRVIRACFVLVLVVQLGYLGVVAATSTTENRVKRVTAQAALPAGDRTPLVGERANRTVVTTRGATHAIGANALYVWGRDGRLVYFETRTKYADVDPSPTGARTLLVAADAPAETDCAGRCRRQIIRQVNYSTGVATDVESVVVPKPRDSNWHDVDRVGPHRYLVAGIWADEVYIRNTSAGTRPWGWTMQADFALDSGGPYPTDWAHVNDVERLPDGRIMVSPRNHDQVLFIDPDTGLQESWTLGCDDCFETLYEQHNPDYIPAERGGPAVLVADSENNRIIEYQRRNGSWVQSWVWQDDRMDWPRDADRLPNGHTLITDTHAHRVIEVNRTGAIVWQAPAPYGYEAERLGTGDESVGGPSAVRANLTSVGENTAAGATAHKYANEGERTQWRKTRHEVLWLTPLWMGLSELLIAIQTTLVGGAWLVAECRWAGVRMRRPVVWNGDSE